MTRSYETLVLHSCSWPRDNYCISERCLTIWRSQLAVAQDLDLCETPPAVGEAILTSPSRNNILNIPSTDMSFNLPYVGTSNPFPQSHKASMTQGRRSLGRMTTGLLLLTFRTLEIFRNSGVSAIL
ncbi:hypothetical protein Tco_0336119 [Tanacetum coccineum]